MRSLPAKEPVHPGAGDAMIAPHAQFLSGSQKAWSSLSFLKTLVK
jgi:hypothetical protein